MLSIHLNHIFSYQEHKCENQNCWGGVSPEPRICWATHRQTEDLHGEKDKRLKMSALNSQTKGHSFLAKLVDISRSLSSGLTSGTLSHHEKEEIKSSKQSILKYQDTDTIIEE